MRPFLAQWLTQSWFYGGLARWSVSPGAPAAGGVVGSWLSYLFPSDSVGEPCRGHFPTLLFDVLLPLLVLGSFGVLAFGSTTLIAVALWPLFGLTVVSCWIFRRWVPLNAIDWLVVAYVVMAVIATAFSSYVKPSVMGLAKTLTLVSAYGTFRLILANCRANRLTFLLVGLGLMGVLESGVGFYQYVNHVQPLATWVDPTTNPELTMTRVFGTVQPLNPNLFAGFLIPCFAAAVALKASTFGALMGKKNAPKAEQRWALLWGAFWALASIAILVCLVLTGSRGGWLAILLMAIVAVVGSGYVLWTHPKVSALWQRLWLAGVLGAMLLVAVAIGSSEAIQHRMASIGAFWEDSSIAYRFKVYKSALAMIGHNPWVGIGPGNDTFKLVYGMYMTPGTFALGAYSLFLEVAVEMGIPGLLIFLVMMTLAKLRTIVAMEVAGIKLSTVFITLALWMGIVGFLGHGLFDTVWYRPPVNVLFWFLLAALVTQTHDSLVSGQTSQEATP